MKHARADCIIDKKFASLSEAEAWQRDGTLKSSPSKYYGVKAGHVPGVYTEYSEVLAQIKGYPKAKQKSFKTRDEAQAYVDETKATSSDAASKRMTPADISTAASAAASTKGEAESELSLADVRKGCKVSDNAPKRLKKNSGGFTAIDPFNGDFEPGEGPLPLDAEDGFDPTIKLDPSTGRVVRKSEAELNSKKWQPTGEFSGPLVVYTDGSSLGNGKVGAVAGVGVFFGSNDARYALSQPLRYHYQTDDSPEMCPRRSQLRVSKLTNEPNSMPSNAPSTLYPSIATPSFTATPTTLSNVSQSGS